jgi:hypothetical protein
MRKLAWFIIIVLIVALTLVSLCLYSPAFSAGLYDIAVNYIGASIVNGITGGATGIMAWGATGLAPALAVFLGTGILFTILWLVLLKKYIWQPIRGVGKTVGSTVTLRGGPEPELPASIEKSAPAEVSKEETKT